MTELLDLVMKGMTDKRFKLQMNSNRQVDIIDYVESKEKNALCIYNDLGVLPFSSAREVCDLLNELHEENEQLKEQLQTIQELFGDTIRKNEEAIEWGKTNGADIGAISFHNEMLKRMKGDLE